MDLTTISQLNSTSDVRYHSVMRKATLLLLLVMTLESSSPLRKQVSILQVFVPRRDFCQANRLVNDYRSNNGARFLVRNALS